MEKIYMQDEQNSKKQRSGVNFSIMLSFVVAAFAIFSLVVFGFSQISYAAPLDPETTSFQLYGVDSEGDKIYGYNGTTKINASLYAPMYADPDLTIPVFCVQKTVDPGLNNTYNRDGEINDEGLLYILNNSYASGKSVISDSSKSDENSEAWVTQMAIWGYLYDKDPDDPKNAMDLEAIKSVTNLKKCPEVYTAECTYVKDFGASVYETYVQPLINKAKSVETVNKIFVEIDGDGIAKVEGTDYYQTGMVTVTGSPSSDLNGFDVTVSGIEGLVVVGQDGEKLETLTNLAPGTKFYVRVPSNQVSDTAKKLSINATGHFATLTGNYFVTESGEYQKVVTVKASSRNVSGGAELEVLGTPDTGLNKAQTIYFIGLIVLLCGIGIVYANAKPVENA